MYTVTFGIVAVAGSTTMRTCRAPAARSVEVRLRSLVVVPGSVVPSIQQYPAVPSFGLVVLLSGPRTPIMFAFRPLRPAAAPHPFWP